MKKMSLTLNRVAIVTGLALGAFALSAIADWSAPAVAPPSCPTGSPGCDAPLNVGSLLQTKAGSLQINGSLGIVGNLIVGTGTPAVGEVLTAIDTNGTVGWGNAIPQGSCPGGQYVNGFDSNGDLVCQSTAAVEYYFGGMYGTGSASYTNPLAGNTKSCPSGYHSFRILGTVNTDYNIYLCIGTSDLAVKVAEFGGMYGYPSSAYSNRLAGNTFGCPNASYKTQQVAGVTNVDWNLFYCYAPVGTAPVIAHFHGAYGGLYNGTANTYYSNPVTGGPSCGINDVSNNARGGVIVYGTTNVDFPLYYCYQ